MEKGAREKMSAAVRRKFSAYEPKKIDKQPHVW